MPAGCSTEAETASATGAAAVAGAGAEAKAADFTGRVTGTEAKTKPAEGWGRSAAEGVSGPGRVSVDGSLVGPAETATVPAAEAGADTGVCVCVWESICSVDGTGAAPLGGAVTSRLAAAASLSPHGGLWRPCGTGWT